LGNAVVKKLYRPFFARPAIELAEDLIGKVLVRRASGVRRRARIVETEAYVGPEDLACHSSRGKTKRTEVMFGPAGHAYVYLIYGMYDMFNIVAGAEPSGQAVLIRAGEALDGWEADLSGPGKLARGMGITRRHNGVDLAGGGSLGGELSIWDAGSPAARVVRTKRIGVDYAEHWKDELLRFLDGDSGFVSGVKKSRRTSPV
jgi:DNA-3-methyladenine glycosylase